MPPRYLAAGIVAFWAAMTGLFLSRDVWPRLAPSEPLLFPVDIVDEVGRGQFNEVSSWKVAKNGTAAYRAEVEWLYHREDDSFESKCKLDVRWRDDAEAPRARGESWLPQVRNVEMTSSYRLTRAGHMRAFAAETTYLLAGGTLGPEEVKVAASVTGEPQRGRAVPHLQASFPGLAAGARLGPVTARRFAGDGDAVEVSERGTVLNPLHPPRRLPDLREGQHWRVPVIDPLAVAGLAGQLDGADAAAGRGAYVLDARVLPGIQAIDWEGGTDVPCRAVAFSGGGPVAGLTLWARAADGVVMRLEVVLWGDSWSFLRLPIGYKMRSVPRPPGKAP